MHGVDTVTAMRRRPTVAAGVCGSGLPWSLRDRLLRPVREQKGTDVFVEAMCALLPRYPISARHRRRHYAGPDNLR